jgi:hypothetical protein
VSTSIERFEKGWIVSSATSLASPEDPAIHSTTVFSTMTNHAVPVDEARAICSGEQEMKIRNECGITRGIPYGEALVLNSSEVMHTNKQKRINVLRFVWPRYESARSYMDFAIAFVGGKIYDDPDIHPTVGLLLFVQLCSVKRYHKDNVILFYISVQHCT